MTTAIDLSAGAAELGSWTATAEQPVTAATLNEGDAGKLGSNLSFGRQQRTRNPKFREAFDRCLDLYESVLSGNPYSALRFKEAMSTSDFPTLFGTVIDRMVYDTYTQQPVQWTQLARRGTVRDFRPVSRYSLDGAESALPQVDELTEYPAAKISPTPYTYSVTKRGRRIPMSWEAWLNGGDLDAFRDLPTRLANAARRTEEKFATGLYAAASGPNGTFFSTGNKNIINPTTAGGSITNPPLSISALQLAFQVLAAQVDVDGEPIYVEGVTLVVPPALEVVARNILNATEIRAAAGGGVGTGADQVTAANWMRDKVTLVVNPWLPIISTTNGNTSWYLVANPNVGRPAIEVGFLLGHESPEIWMKSPDAVRVGGGFVDPEMGDFNTDSVQWRVRHIVGGTLVDSKAAVASNGSGS